MKLVKVLIEYKISSGDDVFTYACNDDISICIGLRVYVPFKNQHVVGYVIEVQNSNKKIEELNKELGFNLKYIDSVIDEKPILNDELYNLALKMKEAYVCPLISCLQTILPPSYKPSKKAINLVKDKKLKKVYAINDANLEKLKPYQIELYQKIKAENGIFYKDLSYSMVNTLIKAKVLEIKEEIIRDDFFKDYQSEIPIQHLNDEQKDAYNTIINGQELVYLLEGVTGSGKTEVYIALVKYYIEQNKTAIILVPEISLTPMIIKRFRAVFKDVAILHGQLSAKEKKIQYDKIKNKEVNVVIGARSAIFAPLENIGIIILDEEQSTSYKQDNEPTYNAKMVATYRALYHHAKVLLGSATPSFESKARAEAGLYKLIYLRKRANQHELPKIEIVNMKDDVSNFSSIMSYTLDFNIKETLKKKEKIILLQNRRGYSPFVSCRNCSYTFKCPNCDLSMSYHKNGDKFKCHYCNFEMKFNHICPKCNNNDFLFMGSGTQRIEEVIFNNYKEAKILRMDNDTTSVKNGHLKILEKFEKEDYNILLGTQMVAKGLDFKDVTLVGVIDADISLHAQDFRSNEFTYELLEQVAGRAGRGEKSGKVIIQTYNPTHFAIEMAKSHDYDAFYKKDMISRAKMNYPPYSYMSSITILCEKADQACILGDKMAEFLKKVKDFEILGPAFPYFYKENDKIRVKLLIKCKKRKLINEKLNEINNLFKVEAKERKCIIKYDIDIYHLL